MYAGLPEVACAYLLTEAGRAVFIETNTTHAAPILLSKLDELAIPRENVDYVIITHVHLDHAGGASALLKACPNAQLLAHPKAARHMISPSRLVESSKLVYGEENFEKLYGQIDPIEESRVRIMLDGESLVWGNRRFDFIYTRGHANHHFCIYDSGSKSIFTGDSFGIAYPKTELGGRFIFPTTTPTDFNYEEAVRSLDLIVNTEAKSAYLTHFGSIGDLRSQANHLQVGLALCRDAVLEARAVDQSRLGEFFRTKVKEMITQLANEQNVNLTAKDWQLLDLDVDLNAQGLAFALKRNP
jgi:glyoxylase-like metal-dependent hydrolase (beta-lactamase superfamily II)